MTFDKGANKVGSRGAILALATAAILFGGFLLPACSAQPQAGAEPAEAAGGDKVVAKVMGGFGTGLRLGRAGGKQEPTARSREPTATRRTT